MTTGKRSSQEQMVSVPPEIDAGASVDTVAQTHGITDQTIDGYRERYAGMTKSELAEFKYLQGQPKLQIPADSCPPYWHKS